MVGTALTKIEPRQRKFHRGMLSLNGERVYGVNKNCEQVKSEP